VELLVASEMRGRLHRTRSSGAAKGASAPQLARRFHTASTRSRGGADV